MIDRDKVKGKNALQQLYQFQMARYIVDNKTPPTFQLKMPDCFEINGTPHCLELFNEFLNLRNAEVPKELVDLLFLEKPARMDELPHNDAVFHEKIVNYVLQR